MDREPTFPVALGPLRQTISFHRSRALSLSLRFLLSAFLRACLLAAGKVHSTRYTRLEQKMPIYGRTQQMGEGQTFQGRD